MLATQGCGSLVVLLVLLGQLVEQELLFVCGHCRPYDGAHEVAQLSSCGSFTPFVFAVMFALFFVGHGYPLNGWMLKRLP